MELKIQFIEQKNMLRDELDDLVDQHDDLLDEYGELNEHLHEKVEVWSHPDLPMKTSLSQPSSSLLYVCPFT